MNPLRGRRTLNQQGFAAIVIALVLILVLSLLTVGFAELMRREQRSALDKHLSSQAYYAAESGINDAIKAINAGFNTTKTQCGPYTSGQTSTINGSRYLTNKEVGGGGNGISYTCLLIDPSPTSLEFGPRDVSESKVVQMTGANPNDPSQTANISYLVISWEEDPKQAVRFASDTISFPTVANWTANTGMLRIGLLPLNQANMNRSYFQSNFYQAFLYPDVGGSARVDLSSSGYPRYTFASGIGDNGGVILKGECHAQSKPRYCNVAINLSASPQPSLMLAMRWIYKTSRVTVKAYDSGGQTLRIKGAQTLIDSTGKAQDVLRRVQVRVPLTNSSEASDFGLDIMNGICKQIIVLPGSSQRQCTP